MHHKSPRNYIFWLYIYSASGVRPDPARVQAIADTTPPKNVTELQSFLGMITAIAPHIPNLSDHTAPLQKLLRKDLEFIWQPQQQKAFEKIKATIQNAHELTYFDPNKQTVVQVDASQECLGAALTQNGKPIAFASKSLTDIEQRYANI